MNWQLSSPVSPKKSRFVKKPFFSKIITFNAWMSQLSYFQCDFAWALGCAINNRKRPCSGFRLFWTTAYSWYWIYWFRWPATFRMCSIRAKEGPLAAAKVSYRSTHLYIRNLMKSKVKSIHFNKKSLTMQLIHIIQNLSPFWVASEVKCSWKKSS